MEPESRMLRVCKLSSDSTTPRRATSGSAGYDLFSPISTTIGSYDKQLIPLDIAFETPDGTYGRIAPRSGLAHMYFIDVGAGVIDRDYRGNVHVLLFNFGTTPYHIKKGDRIAQLILERICVPQVEEVDVLCDTSRNESGFMSTGR
jgi:dUTP pyrophosphatase